jgi:serine/threonine-protein kinase RsbW
MPSAAAATVDRDKEDRLGLGEVRLAVPATPEYLRMTRMMAAGVASRVGFTFDEVDDLRIAIDEICYSLIGAAGRPGQLVVRYEMLDDGLVIEGEGHFLDGPSGPPALSAFSAQILSAVVDECEVAEGADGPTFRLVKHRRVL